MINVNDHIELDPLRKSDVLYNEMVAVVDAGSGMLGIMHRPTSGGITDRHVTYTDGRDAELFAAGPLLRLRMRLRSPRAGRTTCGLLAMGFLKCLFKYNPGCAASVRGDDHSYIVGLFRRYHPAGYAMSTFPYPEEVSSLYDFL